MNEAVLTIVGNLGGDPEMRFTTNNAGVCTFNVAHTPRTREGEKWTDGATTWYRVTAWRGLAENIVESLHKGDRVVVTGPVQNRAYDGKDGEIRYSLEITAYEVGAALSLATAKVTRASGGAGGANRERAGAGDPEWEGATPAAAKKAAPAASDWD